MREVFFTLYWDIMPIILQLIAAALGYILFWVANVAKTRWGIEIEARHREALHSALMSGIRAALGRGLQGKNAVDAALSYASESVPDALAALKPNAVVLADLAASKLREAISQTPLIDLQSSLPDLLAEPLRR